MKLPKGTRLPTTIGEPSKAGLIQSVIQQRSPKSLLEESVEAGLYDRFVNFGLGTAGGHSADRFAVHLDRKAALVREIVRERQGLNVSLLHVVGGIFRGRAISRGVPRLLLRELNRVE